MPFDPNGDGGRLLALLQAALLQNDPGFNMPKRVAMLPGGLFIDDGPGLTVHLSTIHLGKPGQPTTSGPIHPSRIEQSYVFEVNLLRSVAGPTGSQAKAPGTTRLTEDFGVVADDAKALWEGLVVLHAAGLIVPVNEPLVYGPLTTVGPEGNIAGCRCPVSWQVT